MSKKTKGKKSAEIKNTQWLPEKGSSDYFFASSDEWFKEQHPVGYFFLVLLAIFALILPVAIFIWVVSGIYDMNSPWLIVGWIGAFCIGVGLFNYVAIIIRQFMGHLLSLIAFVIGGAMVYISILLSL